jgi:hypothetical protein
LAKELFERFRFGHSQVPDKKLLAVQVAGFNGVEVGQDEPAYPGPGQADGDGRSQSAQSRYADTGFPNPLMNARRMAGDQKGLQFFGRRDAALFDQDNPIFVFDQVSGISGVAVDNQNVSGGQYPLGQPGKSRPLRDPTTFFIDPYGYHASRHHHLSC